MFSTAVTRRSPGARASIVCCTALLWLVGLSLATLSAQAQYQQGADSNWTVVKEWSGERDQSKKTETFPAPSRPWRISYKTPGGMRYGMLDIVVRTKDGRIATALYGRQSDDVGVLNGSLLVNLEPRDEYYLEVTSYGLQWTVAIEQKRP